MVTRVAADKGVLKWARKRNKLSIESAATLLKCNFSLLEKIEKGDLSPTATLFRRMSDVYVLPEATLLGLATPLERPLPRDFRSFDGAPIALSYETIAAIRKVEARQEALAYLAEIDGSVVAPNLPIHFLKEDAGKLGANFRQQLGFPIISQLRFKTGEAFTNWRILIENLGVAVYIEPLGEDYSRGISIFFNDFPAIVVDQNEKLSGARSFTLLHEFGHILLRQSGISNFNSRNTIERFCNQFAAAFLLPIEAIEAAFPRDVLESEEPTIPQLEAAAKKLCVTISQLARRLEDVGRAKTGYFNRIVSTLSPPVPQKPSKGGPDYKYVYLSRFGHHLPDAVFASLDRGAITAIQASRMLDLSPNNFAPIRQVIKDRRVEIASEHLH
jgi:Zn-dependent peptidase ImmA (M78 family)/transcriptional regulator with XRE-family HTH domain